MIKIKHLQIYQISAVSNPKEVDMPLSKQNPFCLLC